jgi:NTP pyrophosphatase (non-canonical NTP hydrolase)
MNDELKDAVNLLANASYAAAVAFGWHNDPKAGQPRTLEQNHELFPVRIALCHSELSEALEGHRKGLMDDKLPRRPMAEVELADLVIRAGDLAVSMGYDLGGAVAEKLAFNATRDDHKVENRNKPGGKAY